MALTERLQILVTADARGAASEFQKIGATADRELGRTEGRIQKLGTGLTSFGTQLGAAGAVASVGMFSLARAAGDYQEEVSAAGVIFGDASEQIEDFGKDALDSAGMSRQAAVEAANTFGTFGKAAGLTGDDLAGFSVELTQLAGDLASFKNTSTEDAIAALGSALRGESEPLRRYGVLLDDATLKAEAMELGIYDGSDALTSQQKILAAQSAIFKQTTDAQGDYARTSDSISNQTKTFAAQMENLKISIGEGAVPVFSELASMANSALSAFQDLSPETQNLVGKIGAIGAIGATGAGALAFVVGQGLRAVDTFKDLSARVHDADGNLTRMGRTTRAAAGALAGIGAVVGVSTLIFDAMNEGSGVAREAEDALNRLTIAIRDGNQENAFQAFADATAAEQNTMRFQNLWQEFGAEVELVGTGVKADVEQVQRTFDSMDASQAKAALDALEDATAALDPNSKQYKINTEFIERNRESLRTNEEATKASNDAMEATDDAAGAAQGGLSAMEQQLQDNADAAEAARKELQNYLDTLRGSVDPFFALASAARGNQEAQFDVAMAENEVKAAEAEFGPSSVQAEQARLKLADAQQKVAETAMQMDAASMELKRGIDDGTISMESANLQLMRWVSEGQMSRDTAMQLARTFGGVAIGAAMAEGKIEDVHGAVGDLDGASATVGIHVDDAAAMETIAYWQRNFGFFSGSMKFLAHTGSRGQTGGAPMWTTTAPKGSSSGGIAGRSSGGIAGRSSGGIAGRSSGGIAGRAVGGPVESGVTYTVNELGAEMFTPRTSGFVMNAADTDKLLAGLDHLVTRDASQSPSGPLIGNYVVHTNTPAQSREQLDRDLRRVRMMVG